MPPFGGFFSKDAIIGLAAHDAGNGSGRAWLVLVGALAGAGITAAYAMRAWLLVFFGKAFVPVDPAPTPEVREPSVLMTGPLVVLATLTLVGGAAVLAPTFLGVSAEPLRPLAIIVTLGVVALGIGVTYAQWRRLEGGDPASALGRWRRLLTRELLVDTAIDATAVRGTRLASRATAAAEVDVVSTYVRGTDALMQLAGRGGYAGPSSIFNQG